MITATVMASSSAMSAPAQLNSSYSRSGRAVYSSSPSCSWLSSSAIPCPRISIHLLPLRFAPLSLIRFSQWSGLKSLGISLAAGSSRTERRKRWQRRMAVYASLFGVGAPEALVIGVVALLVFGPKGLAEVARNLGKTLREFQPTIKELQDVSREFKSTLEREIGLDEINAQNTYSPNRTSPASPPPSITSEEQSRDVVDPNADAAPSSAEAYTSEGLLKITEDQLIGAQQREQQSFPTALSGEDRPPGERSSVGHPPPQPDRQN